MPTTLYNNFIERTSWSTNGSNSMIPAFIAYGNNSSTYVTLNTSDTIVQFSGTNNNAGGHFTTSNNRFTAPIQGLYVFHYGATFRYSTGAGGSYNAVYPKRNGAGISYTWRARSVPPSTNQWTSHTGSWTILLSTNDYVEFYEYAHVANEVERLELETSLFGYLLKTV